MQKCLIISFDFSKEKDGYPSISYSIASIIAKFKNSNFIDIEACSYDMNEYFDYLPEEMESQILEHFRNKYLTNIYEYSFTALSAYSWSENLVNKFVELLRPVFDGKIVLGGYEITAMNKEHLLKTFPNVDYYIKGYAEKSLEKIFQNKEVGNILNEPVTDEEFVSPYLSEVIPLTTEKIYWESKRGCSYNCDFCEWGNAGGRKVSRINSDRIDNEIALFKQKNIQCINVLDPTFLLNEEDVKTLEKLLTIPNCEIHLQVHFYPIKGDLKDKFFTVCQKYRERVFLEFGLQTIHKEEMNVLGRNNDIEHIKEVMKELNTRRIQYEISIIFGIPGQTVASFEDTISFIEENKCGEFRAFPLRLPHNSKMKERKKELKIKETQSPHDPYSLMLVTESYSFTYSDWEKMYSIANKSNKKRDIRERSTIPVVPIIDKAVYHYFTGGLRNVIYSNMTINILFDKKTREKFISLILKYLQDYETSNIALSGFGIENFENAIESILSDKTMRELCAKDPSLAEHIAVDILDFINKSRRRIQKSVDPYENEQILLDNFQQTSKDTFEKSWEITAPFIKENYPQILDPEFYYEEFQKSLSPSRKDKNSVSFESVREHFTDKWGGLLFQKKLKWELKIIEEQRKIFCEEFYKQIEQLKKLQELLEPFMGELGRLWDMSKGRWQKVNFDILEKYAKLLGQDESLQKLAEMLGRMRQAEREYEKEIVIKSSWKAKYITNTAKAELVGIHESNDISNMLPSEAALLADETTELLFYKKIVEKKLQTFEYQAKDFSSKKEITEEKRQKEKEEIKGPFIICVDTSGSMEGAPETIAKTLCFALLKMAVRDNRKCYLILFSTATESLNLDLADWKNNLDKLVEFLSMSFHGGTDVVPAIQKTLKMLETEDYEKADVIIASDFVVGDLDDETINQISTARKNKTKFHSLMIGESGNKKVLEKFDVNWVYNLNNSDHDSILQLVKDINGIYNIGAK